MGGVLNSRVVWVVARRELRDLLRDRRGLFVALACALGLPPLLAIVLQILFSVAVRNHALARSAQAAQAAPAPPSTASVWVHDLGGLPPPCLARLHTAGLALREAPPEVDPRQAVEQKRAQVVVLPPPLPVLAVADVAHTATFALVYDEQDKRSRDAYWTVRGALASWRQELLQERLRREGLERAFLEPISVRGVDVGAPPQGDSRPLGEVVQALTVALQAEGARDLVEGAAKARQAVAAAVVLVLCFTGLLSCLPAAIHMGVLERERGTLEALLLTPAPRPAIALGKAGALALSAVALAGLTALSGALTVAPVALQARAAADPAVRTVFGVLDLPLPWLLLAYLALVPLIVCTAAGTLAVAATTRSEREAGYLLGPIVAGTLLLVIAGGLPPGEGPLPLSDTSLTLIPYAGTAALMRALLTGEATALMALNAVLSSLLCALLAVRHVAGVYAREEAVLRAGASPGFGVFERRNAPDALGRVLPTPPQALFLGLLVLILEWVVGGSLMAAGTQRGLVATGGLVLFALPLAWATALGLDLAPSFGLVRPRPRAVLAGALLGLATPVLAMDVFALQTRLTGELLPEEVAGYERVARELTAGGALVALLVVAVLPGVLEELVFRGFVLGGLRRWGAARAVATSAALFALVHMDPARFGVTGLLGVLFGLLAVGSGSVLPAIVAHGCHNGLAALGGLAAVAALPAWPLRAAALALVGAALALARAPRASG